jgi:predicted nucleic acid-binding protein
VTHGLDTSFLVAVAVAEHPDHAGCRVRLADLQAQGDRFGLTSQVLAEFVHVVSDARRFTSPLSMADAITEAGKWWRASEVDTVPPDDAAVRWFLQAMIQHNLGRKRVLDTMLAATYRTAGITSILTLNSKDFAVFGDFTCLGPSPTVTP